MISVPINNITSNPFNDIGKQWMLITAIKDGIANTMTASWGGLGVLWNKNVATIYVRPQRFTHDFLEAADTFTLSFLPDQYRNALTLCGRTSGRDTNKIAEAGLTTVFSDNYAYFSEAERVIVCRKIYKSRIVPNGFLDNSIASNYPDEDYHTVYIGEITACLQ